MMPQNTAAMMAQAQQQGGMVAGYGGMGIRNSLDSAIHGSQGLDLADMGEKIGLSKSTEKAMFTDY